jgi:hypothetical protein
MFGVVDWLAEFLLHDLRTAVNKLTGWAGGLVGK